LRFSNSAASSPIMKEPTGDEEETIRQYQTAHARYDTDYRLLGRICGSLSGRASRQMPKIQALNRLSRPNMTCSFSVSNCRALFSVAEPSSLPPLRRLTGHTLNPQDVAQPVKQRRALLASNPLRNSRLETHRDDEGRVATCPSSLDIVTIDFPCLGKRPCSDLRESLRIYPQIPLRNQKIKTFLKSLLDFASLCLCASVAKNPRAPRRISAFVLQRTVIQRENS